ncbi:hypothetical protein OAM67_00560 [bacterium]|nr:hypothetical protein [bacterium]
MKRQRSRKRSRKKKGRKNNQSKGKKTCEVRIAQVPIVSDGTDKSPQTQVIFHFDPLKRKLTPLTSFNPSHNAPVLLHHAQQDLETLLKLLQHKKKQTPTMSADMAQLIDKLVQAHQSLHATPPNGDDIVEVEIEAPPLPTPPPQPVPTPSPTPLPQPVPTPSPKTAPLVSESLTSAGGLCPTSPKKKKKKKRKKPKRGFRRKGTSSESVSSSSSSSTPSTPTTPAAPTLPTPQPPIDLASQSPIIWSPQSPKTPIIQSLQSPKTPTIQSLQSLQPPKTPEIEIVVPSIKTTALENCASPKIYRTMFQDDKNNIVGEVVETPTDTKSIPSTVGRRLIGASLFLFSVTKDINLPVVLLAREKKQSWMGRQNNFVYTDFGGSLDVTDDGRGDDAAPAVAAREFVEESLGAVRFFDDPCRADLRTLQSSIEDALRNGEYFRKVTTLIGRDKMYITYVKQITFQPGVCGAFRRITDQLYRARYSPSTLSSAGMRVVRSHPAVTVNENNRIGIKRCFMEKAGLDYFSLASMEYYLQTDTHNLVTAFRCLPYFKSRLATIIAEIQEAMRQTQLLRLPHAHTIEAPNKFKNTSFPASIHEHDTHYNPYYGFECGWRGFHQGFENDRSRFRNGKWPRGVTRNNFATADDGSSSGSNGDNDNSPDE